MVSRGKQCFRDESRPASGVENSAAGRKTGELHQPLQRLGITLNRCSLEPRCLRIESFRKRLIVLVGHCISLVPKPEQSELKRPDQSIVIRLDSLLEILCRATFTLSIAGESRDRLRVLSMLPPAQGVLAHLVWTLMIRRTAVLMMAGLTNRAAPGLPRDRLDFFSLLVVSAWCGLVAGLLEVGAILLRKRLLDYDQFYRMSRHFVWLIPLANLVLFLVLGLLCWAMILFWPHRGRWLFTRIVGALTLLPPMLIIFSRIYSLAWLIVAMGIAARLAPIVEHRRASFRRIVLVSFPAAIAIVAMLAGSLLSGDRSKQNREKARPLPSPGAPNVLLVVMDTVAAGHLSLYGYDRPTSPTMLDLAEHGVLFQAARASTSWTLPSHATMFTGRWLHELCLGWLTPLDREYTTLAEFLGDRGYATAGFVANTGYCGTDSGLARGFTRYEDFVFPRLTFLKTAVLADRALELVRAFAYYFEAWLESAGLQPTVERLVRWLDDDRKGADIVNREFLDWLAYRPQQERPFLAFLNYYDAHYPYELQPGRLHRFGDKPSDSNERFLIQQWGLLDKKTVSPQGVAFATAAYDDCIADLDEQLGILVDKMSQRGILDHTWIIIVSDHGESFGEHAGYFGHGTSLYDTELLVPLLIIPPAGNRTRRIVKDAVQSARPHNHDRRTGPTGSRGAISRTITGTVLEPGAVATTEPAIRRITGACRAFSQQPESPR